MKQALVDLLQAPLAVTSALIVGLLQANEVLRDLHKSKRLQRLDKQAMNFVATLPPEVQVQVGE